MVCVYVTRGGGERERKNGKVGCLIALGARAGTAKTAA